MQMFFFNSAGPFGQGYETGYLNSFFFYMIHDSYCANSLTEAKAMGQGSQEGTVYLLWRQRR